MNAVIPNSKRNDFLKKSLGAVPVPKKVDSNLPTPAQMSELAALFDKSEWLRLCRDKTFIKAVCFDLKEAFNIADNLLGLTKRE